jgi:hypothetical protein
VVESLLEPRLDAGDATDEWWTNAFNSDKTEDVSVCVEEREREMRFSITYMCLITSLYLYFETSYIFFFSFSNNLTDT